ncbi:MAG: ABC transporter permease, partial [Maribacter dokdonensis]|uniref:ABC transporter permease n=1 Tax=Maribacter dokdonensis TaxID=320912 RepID=UPI00329A7340
MAASRPPKFADRLLGWFIKGDVLEEALGDLYEYHDEMEGRSSWKRKLFYWFHVFQFLRPQLVKSLMPKNQRFFWEMINFNSKIALRTLLNNKLVSITSMTCLILGSLCFQLIYTWFYNELSTDKFHTKIDRVYMGVARTNPMADLAPVSLQAFFNLDYDQFPEIENKLVLHVYRKDEIKFIAGQREFTGKGLITDSTFFDFFDFKISQGTKNLTDPSGIIITQSFANRVFGKTNPIGKSVKIRCDQEGTYKIVGVLDKIPSNSSIYFDFIVPKHSQQFWRRIPLDLILTSPHFDYTA